MLLRSEFVHCLLCCSYYGSWSDGSSHSTLTILYRCLIMIEDFDRSENGDQGEIGLAILEQRYEDLMQEDIYQTEKWMEQLVY